MAKTLKVNAAVDEDTRIREEIQYYLDEIEQATERMNKRQSEIDGIKSRTRAILTELSQLRLTSP